MKISIFKSGIYNIGVDYSDNKECIGVFDINEFEAEKLQNGCIPEINKGKLQIIKNEEYKNNVFNLGKKELIEGYKILQKEIIEIRAEIEDLQDNIEKGNIEDESKLLIARKRIEILENRRTEKRNAQDLLSQEGIEKYGIEILSEF